MARQLTAEHGYDQVSMRTIAAESGVVEKTLYNIFGSKIGLIASAAQERTSDVFEEAARSAGEDGWVFILNFAQAAANKTLEAPAMARALVPLLLEQTQAMGLNQLYDRHFGKAVSTMVESGALSSSTIPLQEARLIRLAVVAVVHSWAKGQITDDELRPSIELGISSLLLPLARTGKDSEIRTRIATARAILSNA